MAENSNIEWTHHTFNPWRGCTKVSAGCKNCYAETFSKRNPKVLGIWGDAGTRPVASESYWKVPLEWDRAAAAAGERHRVFCSSLADVFEDREELHAPRLRLFDLIRRTPHLDWLLLTKRPENIRPAIETAWKSTTVGDDLTLTFDLRVWLGEWLEYSAPHNVWLGTSVESQEVAELRLPELLSIPAVVHFASCEPLLGPVVLEEFLPGEAWHNSEYPMLDALGWVIVGGESGPKARPMHPAWAQGLAAQCSAAGVPFLFKQWGEWLETSQMLLRNQAEGRGIPIVARLGYTSCKLDEVMLWRTGKHEAGRLLDGQLWDEFPARP